MACHASMAPRGIQGKSIVAGKEAVPLASSEMDASEAEHDVDGCRR
jgi:hypothetical protein